MLMLAFLRVDPADLRRHWTRPGLTAAAVAWSMLVVPTVLGTLALAAGLGHRMPGLYFMLVLQLSAPGADVLAGACRPARPRCGAHARKPHRQRGRGAADRRACSRNFFSAKR